MPIYLFGLSLPLPWTSLVAQMVKNPPAMRETWVRSLGWEDPLEKGSHLLQYSGLENSMDCIVRGVTKSQTHLATEQPPPEHSHHILWSRNAVEKAGFLVTLSKRILS